MVIEKLREKARREALEQRNLDEAKLAKKRRRRRGPSKPLIPRAVVAHKVFVPLIAGWGAALAGLSVMALSSVPIARLSMFAGLGALGSFAQVVFAVIAAAIGGAFAFVAANLFKGYVARTAKGGPVATMAARRVKPIDPATELGSESLDAPIEEMPFGATPEDESEPDEEPALLDADGIADQDGEVLEPEAASVAIDLTDTADLDNEDHEEPELDELDPDELDLGELDLGEFSDFEDDTDTVIVSANPLEDTAEPEAEAEPKPYASLIPASMQPQTPVPPTTSVEKEPADQTQAMPAARSGIEKLRQTPPKDLSLVQLVERFAAALHDAQDAPRAMVAKTQGDPKREAALAEALKALSQFTERGFSELKNTPEPSTAGMPAKFGSAFAGQAGRGKQQDQEPAINETERELREALSKLQDLQGAA
jgi:hypothetical protein